MATATTHVLAASNGRTKTRDERSSLLARHVTSLLAQGRRLETQSDFEAVLVKGRLLWESREIVSVDAWGNVSVQQLGIENKERLFIALAAVAVFLVLIVLGAVFG